MAYSSIPDSIRAVGKPITADLLDNIHFNLEDLNTRLASISLAAGSNIVCNELVEPPEEDLPVGSIVFASLSSAQFTANLGAGEWVLADGTSVLGSDWAVLTGRTTLPDVRGRFLRGKSNGSGNSPLDPALDAYTADSIVSHLHNMNHGHANTIGATTNTQGNHIHTLLANDTVTTTQPVETYTGAFGNKPYLSNYGNLSNDLSYYAAGTSIIPLFGATGAEGSHSHTVTMSGGVTNMAGDTGSTGGSETAPRYVTENVFIKINRSYIKANTRLFAFRIEQQTTLNNILVTPVQQGTSGSFTIDIKKGASPTTASQSIFQSGSLPTLPYNGSAAVTGLTDSNQNVVAAGQFIVVSVTTTQTKLKEVHIFIGGDY